MNYDKISTTEGIHVLIPRKGELDMGKDLKGRELGVGIRQRPDNRYEARATINGQLICLYNMNLPKLRKEFKEAKDAVKENLDQKAKTITLSEWFDIWFESYKKPYLKESSAIVMYSRFKNVFGRLGYVPLRDLTNLMIQNVVNDEVQGGRAASNIREVAGVLRNCLESARNNRMLLINPAYEVVLPQVVKFQNKPHRFITREEQNTFLKYSNDNWYYEMLYIMFFTGMRIGEVGGLQWENVDFDNKCFNINFSLRTMYHQGNKIMKLVPPKTPNSYRKIPFIGEVEKMLISQKRKTDRLKKELKRRWRMPEEIGDPVFVTTMGSPVTRYIADKETTKIVKRINCEENILAVEKNRKPIIFETVTPHDLRHAFCCRCFESGVHPKVVQALMGHADYAMTMNVYTHVSERTIRAESQKVISLFDEKDFTQLDVFLPKFKLG